eukprot:TRINITY_DN3224_c0_g1_i1.p1 TRINITY_DN3224_c0_g1~~TRINITY_DN3224_c0_g1_i1.p1  ORF type:complete len:363 (+),score=65.79 TRINITY_DN3224_c0_g1_i1:79-1167(+)
MRRQYVLQALHLLQKRVQARCSAVQTLFGLENELFKFSTSSTSRIAANSSSSSFPSGSSDSSVAPLSMSASQPFLSDISSPLPLSQSSSVVPLKELQWKSKMLEFRFSQLAFKQPATFVALDGIALLDSKRVSHWWTNVILPAYQESHRFYHTLQHLEEMFISYDEYWPYLFHPLRVQLAIFFHDIVYSVHSHRNSAKSPASSFSSLSVSSASSSSSTTLAASSWVQFPSVGYNERESANLFEQFADECHLNKECRNEVVRMIEHTSDHMQATPTTPDMDFMLDFDLRILGSEWVRYELYMKSVRQEYAHLSEKEFVAGRSAFLSSLLRRPRLYRTRYFFNRFEKLARNNAQQELLRLSRSG